MPVNTFLQFGMLIEYLFENFPNVKDVNETAIGDLQVFLFYFGLNWIIFLL